MRFPRVAALAGCALLVAVPLSAQAAGTARPPSRAQAAQAAQSAPVQCPATPAAPFAGGHPTSADFEKAASTTCLNLRGEDLTGVSFGQGSLQGSDLTGATAEQVDFSQADLTGANLSGADLKYADFGQATLKMATFTGANLQFARFIQAHLEGANLTSANLQQAKLGQAYLTGATLVAANLMHADLGQVELGGASLRGAMIQHADFTQADLVGTDFDQATIGGTTFTQATFGANNFAGVKGTFPVHWILLALFLVVFVGGGALFAASQVRRIKRGVQAHWVRYVLAVVGVTVFALGLHLTVGASVGLASPVYRGSCTGFQCGIGQRAGGGGLVTGIVMLVVGFVLQMLDSTSTGTGYYRSSSDWGPGHVFQ